MQGLTRDPSPGGLGLNRGDKLGGIRKVPLLVPRPAERGIISGVKSLPVVDNLLESTQSWSLHGDDSVWRDLSRILCDCLKFRVSEPRPQDSARERKEPEA